MADALFEASLAAVVSVAALLSAAAAGMLELGSSLEQESIDNKSGSAVS